MVIFKVVRHSNGGYRYMVNMLRYIFDDRALDMGFNGISCYGTNEERVQKALHEMLIVREFFGKVSGNPLIQFIVSYDSKVNNAHIASALTKEIAKFLDDRHQYIWVLHYKPRIEVTGLNACYHAHIVINPVSYVDGKMYSGSPENVHAFARYIAGITGTSVRIECAYETTDGKMNSFYDNHYIHPAFPISW